MTGPWFEQPTLTGEYVRLEPLTLAHAEDLYRAADDPTLFRWTWRPIESVSDATEYISHALDDPRRLAYVQIDTATGVVVGTTSYYQIDPLHQSLAIGYTWLSRSAQGGRINPEAKLLLLRRAFEDLGAVRIEWHTDELNAHSRGAIAKLGAEFEGLLRKHRRRQDGSWRNTALFSMIDDDWPLARAQLEARISE
ncbi:acetyltransferase domain protein [Rhodococcus sp. MTM3W5.2]|uniref:GNAT family N-acetyltransferase n=1 Tax=Rhodococcus sp. MTM3W5.2 TaxID=1805827 RepID=UPI0009796015|nr:GNAT family protein [Rhodococcus sp. MTM3W5.2]AQA20758.1 acetyltransferase domain protein [Rhodococcus sp. MTM3W5.2]